MAFSSKARKTQALARAFGALGFKDYGVIAVLEVKLTKLLSSSVSFTSSDRGQCQQKRLCFHCQMAFGISLIRVKSLKGLLRR